jgi:PKD repeat protein
MRTSKIFSFIFIICFLFTVSAFCYAGPNKYFDGYVYDIDSGAPISGATIIVGNGQLSDPTTVYAETDAEGYYKSPAIPRLTDYTVLPYALGYESQAYIMETPSSRLDFYLQSPQTGNLVETINEGLKHYAFDGTINYRTSGAVQEGGPFFPDIDVQNATISAFLDNIGAGTDETAVPSEMWNKAKITWEWLVVNAYFNTSDHLWQEASDFMMIDGWPSIERIAMTYNQYGFLPWGTCMSRAQLYTTLLHRVGIPKDYLGIADTRWMLRYSQHDYTIIYLQDRWVYLDPTFSGSTFPSFAYFTSIPLVGGGDRDYSHPYEVIRIPGSSLSVVPEITARDENSFHVFITQPPDTTNTLADSIEVSGHAPDAGITEVTVNGQPYPVVDGLFSATVPLPNSENIISAEVVFNSVPYHDEITVFRSNTGSGCTAPPVASFYGTPVSGSVPLTVSFTDTSTEFPTSWTWDFGDGQSSTNQNPVHQYTSEGTYTVSLTASNACGSDTYTMTDYISVWPACTDPPQILSFSGTPTSGTAPLTVDFLVLYMGQVDSWSWDFGDGQTADVRNPIHVYASAGTYTVTVTAINGCGSTPNTKVDYIIVDPGSSPVMHVASQDVVRVATGGPNYRADDTVVIQDQNGQPITGADVTASYTGPTSGTVVGTTDSSGTVVLSTDRTKNNLQQTWCFTVTDVVLQGAFYDPNANTVTTQCETLP